MDEIAPHHQVDLREYLAVLRNRKWTVLLVGILVVASALGFSYAQTPMYTGKARLLIRGIPTSTGTASIQNLETEGEIIGSHPVAVLALEELGLDQAPEEVLQDLDVATAAEESSILTISYTSPDQELSASVSNAFANSYIEHKRQQAESGLEASRASLQAQIDPIEEQLNEINTQLTSPAAEDDPALRATLETEQAGLSARLGILQQRLSDVLATQPQSQITGEIIEPALVPSAPSSPNHTRNGVLAALVGLALGVGLAFLRERLDDRLKGRDDLERFTKAPVLATIPRFSRSSKQAREIITISQPGSAASEAYRTLRTNVQFLSLQSELKSLLVSSASAGEGKTVSSINLAVAFAQAGRRVILLSADLRRPTVEAYFGLPNREGLSSWLLAADRELWNLILDPGIDNLRVLPSGPIPPNPAELLTSPRFGELLQLLEANADLVIVDSAPTLAVADPAIISSQTDGTLLVVDATNTRRSSATRAAEELRRVGANVLGTVLNSFDASASPYYYAESGYGSAYESHALPHVQDGANGGRRSLLGRRR